MGMLLRVLAAMAVIDGLAHAGAGERARKVTQTHARWFHLGGKATAIVRFLTCSVINEDRVVTGGERYGAAL
jgi:uncharacterized protein (DUF3084 family)